MGLFSALKGVLKVVPIVGDAFSANDSKKAARQANGAIQTGISNATGALNSQLATTTANFAPYMGAGTSALGQQGDILGLNGAGAQGSIIDQLKASPYFQSLFRTGQDTVLNNASATGGLRGGNVQSSLANFGSDTLAQTIQQQLANLSPMSQMGLGATTSLGNFGANNAQQIAGLNVGAGQANAGSILGQQAIDNNLYSGLRSTVASAAGIPSGSGGSGGFDLSSLFSKMGGGSPVQSGLASNNSFLQGLGSGQSTWLSTALQPSSVRLPF